MTGMKPTKAQWLDAIEESAIEWGEREEAGWLWINPLPRCALCRLSRKAGYGNYTIDPSCGDCIVTEIFGNEDGRQIVCAPLTRNSQDAILCLAFLKAVLGYRP